MPRSSIITDPQTVLFADPKAVQVRMIEFGSSPWRLEKVELLPDGTGVIVHWFAWNDDLEAAQARATEA